MQRTNPEKQISNELKRYYCLEAHQIAPEISAASNAIYLGDNEDVMTHLLAEYRGKIDCIYLDPPFDVGYNFSASIKLRDRDIRINAFRDKWDSQSSEYYNMILRRLELAYELLSEQGTLFLHCDYRTTAIYRLMLDQLFGADNYINEIVWYYKTGGVPEKVGFSKKHDTIHYYVKNRKRAIWHQQKEKSYLQHKYGFSNIKIEKDERGLYTLVGCRDVIDIPALRGNQPERVDYPTQKPLALLERLILSTTEAQSLVADFFCGSGTTGVAAARNERRFLLADVSQFAVHTARKRLLSNGTFFEIWSSRGTEITSPSVGYDCHFLVGKGRVVDVKISLPSSLDGQEIIDWWAVDFNYVMEEPFRPQICKFRGREETSLQLEVCQAYSFPAAGEFTAAVKFVNLAGEEKLIFRKVNIK